MYSLWPPGSHTSQDIIVLLRGDEVPESRQLHYQVKEEDGAGSVNILRKCHVLTSCPPFINDNLRYIIQRQNEETGEN